MTSEGELLSSDEQKNTISDSEIHEILVAIDDDLMPKKSQNKITNLETLEVVLQKWEPVKIFKFMKKCSNPQVKLLVFKQLQTQVTMCVKDYSPNLIDMFIIEDEGLSQEYVVDILSEAYGNLPQDILKKLLCDVIIPEMFNSGNFSKKVHDLIIDVGFQLIEKFPITNLSNQEIKLFTSNVIEKYSKILENLREQNYSRWHDLWIFFVRFSAKHLHVAMDLANKLLRVVEYAFRNPSYEQRLKGYDCWKELIDNASLDVNHLCSNKQIKLLITPLRAKFSKMEIVICKRFEVFLYLLEKLQSQSVLCLNEFLEFCFGVSNNVNNSSKNGQGKLVPNLWLKSIQVFLAILGDQTHISSALNRTPFEGPVITSNNISKFGNVTVCAVIECSIILKQISIVAEEKISILSSLWEALFDIIVKSTTEIQEKCFQTIFDYLSTVFKEFNEDVTYIGLYAAFTQLLESCIDHRLISDSLKLLLEYSLKFLGETDVSDEFSHKFCELIQIACKEIHLTEFLLEQLKKLETSRNESKLYNIWKILGNQLIVYSEISYHSKMVTQFFLWPVAHLQKFSEQTSVDICSTWLELFVLANQYSDSMKMIIIEEFGKSLKSNPLLSSNIAVIFSLMAQTEIDFTREFVGTILKLILDILSLPLLPQETSPKMYGLVLKCAKTIAMFSQEETDNEIIDYIRQCVEKMNSHQKSPELLEVLDNILNKKIKGQSFSIIEKKKKMPFAIPSPQDATNGTSFGNLKRSIRMTQMAFEKPTLTANKNKVNALQFFGQDVETITPLKVKGSILQNQGSPSPNSRLKKIINSVKKPFVPEPPALEDQTCDYVLIDTEVKLQKDKLTEHQKEELKRRREDIPALYQDLSQSQSQTSSSKDISSNIPETEHNISEKKGPHLDHFESESSSIDFVGCQEIKNYEEENTGTKGSTEPNFASIRKVEEVDSNTDSNDSVNKKTNKKSIGKIQKELMKIQMNIVGGDTFLKNLPSKRPRKNNDKPSTVVTPKKAKRMEQESKMNEEQNQEKENDIRISVSEVADQITKESDGDKCDEFQNQANEISTIVKVEDDNISVPKEQKNLDDLSESNLNENPHSETPSNNRKNKFIKPQKHVDTPKSGRKKIKAETKEISTSKKKMNCEAGATQKKLNIPKTPTTMHKSVEIDLSKEPQSEIMFESEIDIEIKKPNKKRLAETLKKNEKVLPSIESNQQNNSLFEGDSVGKKLKSENGETKTITQKINIEKLKKRPKEIMRRNKEKVRTIQSQLKLANLNDLTDSSLSKKSKGAKLIFIREITNSKHTQNTKVSPAGLKRNKDNKTKNIAYSIEPPVAIVDLVNLDNDGVESSSKDSNLVSTVSSESELQKTTKKRKRTTSISSTSSTSASESSPIKKEKEINKKMKFKKRTVQEASVPDITPINTDSPENLLSELNSHKSNSPKRKPRCSQSQELSKSKSEEVKKFGSPKKMSPHKAAPTQISPDSPSRITRSRALNLSPLEPKLGSSNQNSSRNESIKAVKSLFTESEDIIESSQDSLSGHTTNTSIGNLSRIRNKQSPKVLIVPLKEEMIEDATHKSEDKPVTPPETTISSIDSHDVDQVTKRHLISQADTETCDSVIEPQPTVIDVELPEKPEFTDSEKILSATDTVSIASPVSDGREEEISTLGLDVTENNEVVLKDDAEKIDPVDTSTKIVIEDVTRKQSPVDNQIGVISVATPERNGSGDLPGSPVSNVTPTLTKELLDNTIDISPISSQITPEDEKKNDNEIATNFPEAVDHPENSSEVSRDSKEDDKCAKSQFSLNLRSNKLLNMVNVASPISRSKTNRRIISSPAPVKSRYEKLFSFFNGNRDDESRTDKKDDLIECSENIENILTFSREVPSPLAMPSSSILKRKLTDVDEGFSPSAKRKRVNFSYPCISSTKLYIRRIEEMNTHFRPSFSQNLFGEDYEDEDSADEDHFANPNIEPIGSEESMDITNSLMLCRKKPIYEQLVTCKESLDQLWKRLSSPTYSELLKRILKSKNITTIGDLASLSEVQINRLPFKQPRIKTVRKALNFHFTNVLKKSQEEDSQNQPDSENANPQERNEEEFEEEIARNVAEDLPETNRTEQIADLRERFSYILTKIKDEKIPLEELGTQLLDLVDETEIIRVLKSVYNTDFRKFFEKSHWRYLIETIVQSGGTTEMFDIISDLAENNATFADQLESIVQLRINQNPLRDIISKRPLTELKLAFEDCISHDVFKREDIVQTCFIPLIKSPSDIKSYFNYLTIVQIHDLFIERVQPSDLTLFLDQIREHYGNYTVAQCANKSDVLKICSKEELMTSLMEKEDAVQNVIDLIGKINDQNKLVSLYNYIGNLMSPEIRREAFIEFLNSIPLGNKNVKVG